MWKINLNNNFIAWRPTQEKVWTKSYKKMKTSSFFSHINAHWITENTAFGGPQKQKIKESTKKRVEFSGSFFFSWFFVFPADHHKLRSWFNKPLANNQDIELAEGKKAEIGNFSTNVETPQKKNLSKSRKTFRQRPQSVCPKYFQ